MENTRRQRRLPFSADAKVLKRNSGDRADAKIIDVSNYGTSLTTTIPFKINERIKVAIALNRQGQVVHSEEVPGTVRYVERSKRNYLVGIQFNKK